MCGIIEKKGVRLLTLDEWLKHAPPRGRNRHWKDRRSAKESARSWLDAAPSIPAEIAKTLSSHRDIGPICDWRAEPEARVRFDEFRGPPNIDVLLVGRDKNGPIVVAVEAKADEPFGWTVQKKRLSFKSNPRSNGVTRIKQLCASLFGSTPNERDILDLRYQLLTATAAAMAEAER